MATKKWTSLNSQEKALLADGLKATKYAWVTTTFGPKYNYAPKIGGFCPPVKLPAHGPWSSSSSTKCKAKNYVRKGWDDNIVGVTASNVVSRMNSIYNAAMGTPVAQILLGRFNQLAEAAKAAAMAAAAGASSAGQQAGKSASDAWNLYVGSRFTPQQGPGDVTPPPEVGAQWIPGPGGGPGGGPPPPGAGPMGPAMVERKFPWMLALGAATVLAGGFYVVRRRGRKR
jgi:hypothetical protein